MYVIRKYIWFFFWMRLKIFMLLVLLHSRKSGCNKEAINIFYKKLLISSRIKTEIANILENRQSPFNRNFISKKCVTEAWSFILIASMTLFYLLFTDSRIWKLYLSIKKFKSSNKWSVIVRITYKWLILKNSTTWIVSAFGVFLVRIFPHWDRIQRFTSQISIFSPNAGK